MNVMSMEIVGKSALILKTVGKSALNMKSVLIYMRCSVVNVQAINFLHYSEII